jgi:hypothetical protein
MNALRHARTANDAGAAAGLRIHGIRFPCDSRVVRELTLQFLEDLVPLVRQQSGTGRQNILSLGYRKL